jgi:hypothetical protein
VREVRDRESRGSAITWDAIARRTPFHLLLCHLDSLSLAGLPSSVAPSVNYPNIVSVRRSSLHPVDVRYNTHAAEESEYDPEDDIEIRHDQVIVFFVWIVWIVLIVLTISMGYGLWAAPVAGGRVLCGRGSAR